MCTRPYNAPSAARAARRSALAATSEGVACSSSRPWCRPSGPVQPEPEAAHDAAHEAAHEAAHGGGPARAPVLRLRWMAWLVLGLGLGLG